MLHKLVLVHLIGHTAGSAAAGAAAGAAGAAGTSGAGSAGLLTAGAGAVATKAAAGLATAALLTAGTVAVTDSNNHHPAVTTPVITRALDVGLAHAGAQRPQLAGVIQFAPVADGVTKSQP